MDIDVPEGSALVEYDVQRSTLNAGLKTFSQALACAGE